MFRLICRGDFSRNVGLYDCWRRKTSPLRTALLWLGRPSGQIACSVRTPARSKINTARFAPSTMAPFVRLGLDSSRCISICDCWRRETSPLRTALLWLGRPFGQIARSVRTPARSKMMLLTSLPAPCPRSYGWGSTPADALAYAIVGGGRRAPSVRLRLDFSRSVGICDRWRRETSPLRTSLLWLGRPFGQIARTMRPPARSKINTAHFAPSTITPFVRLGLDPSHCVGLRTIGLIHFLQYQSHCEILCQVTWGVLIKYCLTMGRGSLHSP